MRRPASQFGIAQPRTTEDAGTVAVAQVLGADRVSVRGQIFAPARTGSRQHIQDPAQDRGAHLVEQLLLVTQMPVQGRCADVEPLRERADGDTLDALLVEQFQCGGHDLLARDPLRHG